jgi:RNA polymerase sigma factor (sigma-70 family)
LRLADVRQLQRFERLQPVSLDAPVLADQLPLVEMLDVSVPEADDPQSVVVEAAPVTALTRALADVLEERERAVIALRFGLDGGRRLSLEQAGRELGLSREWIRQTEKTAIVKLRESLSPFDPIEN